MASQKYDFWEQIKFLVKLNEMTTEQVANILNTTKQRSSVVLRSDSVQFNTMQRFLDYFGLELQLVKKSK